MAECKNYCQSCGMPMGDSDELYGANADGTRNEDYCKYCFVSGAFAKEESMDEMIESCVPFVIEANPGMTALEARQMMLEFFPTLKRWKVA